MRALPGVFDDVGEARPEFVTLKRLTTKLLGRTATEGANGDQRRATHPNCPLDGA
jgi:hypothetical protein